MESRIRCHMKMKARSRIFLQAPVFFLLFLTVLKPSTLVGTEHSVHGKNNGKQPDGLNQRKLCGLRLDLVHMDSLLSPHNLTFMELLQRAVKRSEERLQKLLLALRMLPRSDRNSAGALRGPRAPVNVGRGVFLAKLAIGTPPLSFYGIIDTGSELLWTQCEPCRHCYSQSTPIYDPSQSSTYRKVPCQSSLCKALPAYDCTPACEYLYTYADTSSSAGILSFETFTLSSASIPHIAFGCGRANVGMEQTQGAGILGLGRSPLSFSAQLGSYASNKFSYCLMPIMESPSRRSPLIFGEGAALNAQGAKSTPFVRNREYPSFYYLALEGISVGGALLSIPAGTFDIRFDGSGGVVIDCGTTITYLEKGAYDSMRDVFVASIDLPEGDAAAIGLDLCYELPYGEFHPNIPSLTFHFKGADFDLPKDNYFLLDKHSGLLCLAILPALGLSIIGSIQQQNFHILYDNVNDELSFVPAACGEFE